MCNCIRPSRQVSQKVKTVLCYLEALLSGDAELKFLFMVQVTTKLYFPASDLRRANDVASLLIRHSDLICDVSNLHPLSAKQERRNWDDALRWTLFGVVAYQVEMRLCNADPQVAAMVRIFLFGSLLRTARYHKPVSYRWDQLADMAQQTSPER